MKMAKKYKWLIGILLSPFALFLLAVILLYIPPIQNMAVQAVARYASEQTGMDISVGGVRLSFPLNLRVQRTLVMQQRDTLCYADEVFVDVRFLPLLSGKVEVDAVELTEATVNTLDLVDAAEIRGKLKSLFLDVHDADLNASTVRIPTVLIDGADAVVCLRDSVPEDTTKSETPWLVDIEKISLRNSSVQLFMNHDSMSVASTVRQLDADSVALDLKRGAYALANVSADIPSLNYDMRYEPAVSEGLDVQHIALSNILLQADKIQYDTESGAMALRVASCMLKEKSGLNINTFTCGVEMDTLHLKVSDLVLETDDSHVDGNVDFGFDSYEKHPTQKTVLQMNAELGKQDILRFVGGLPAAFMRDYPNTPLVVRAAAYGNTDNVEVSNLLMKLDGAFSFQGQATAANLLDDVQRSAELQLDGKTYNLNFISSFLGDAGKTVKIPNNMSISLNAAMQDAQYKGDIKLTEGTGKVNASGKFYTNTERYSANVKVDNFHVEHFVRMDSVCAITAHFDADGRGTDPFAAGALSTVDAAIDNVRYGSRDLSGVQLNALLQQQRLQMNIKSNNPLIRLTSNLDALMSKSRVDATFSIDAREVDLYALQLMDKPFKAGVCMHLDAETDMKQYYKLDASIADVHVELRDTTMHPKDLELSMLTSRDTTYAHLQAGNLNLDMYGKSGYETILKKLTNFADISLKQLKEHRLNPDEVKRYLPELTFECHIGDDNPLSNFLREVKGVRFEDVDMSFDLHPETGFNSTVYSQGLIVDSLHLDTIRMVMKQDSAMVRYDMRICNGPGNPQITFDADLSGYITPQSAEANLVFMDEKQQKAIDIGARAAVSEEGLRVSFFPQDPVVAYRKFTLNDDNYVFMGRLNNKIEGNVDLLAEDGTGLKFYSTPNEEALQDLSVSLLNFNIGELTTVLPYMPKVGGLLSGDAHMIQTSENLSVYSELQVAGMTYEGCELGDMETELLYLPREDGTHYVRGNVSREGEEIFIVEGGYNGSNDQVDASVTLSHFPVKLIDGFVPDQMAYFRGDIDGDLSVTGTTSNPAVVGELTTDSLVILSDMYSLNLAMEDNTIPIENNRMTLNTLKFYSTGKNPLTVDGYVDFRNLDAIRTDITMNASNFELINAKKTKNSVAYGKVYVDYNGYLRGLLSDLQFRGNLKVLGSTDVTYIVKDMPVSADDRLSELVTFVNFADTLGVEKKEYEVPSGLTMNMSISVDPGTHVHCDISDGGDSYVDFKGGGDLVMRYTPDGNIYVTGKYSISDGTMKYTLPVIPLKTFTIADGSYVEFTGDVMNPTLNITATERVRASVTENDVPQTVSFDVGLVISQTFNNMGLEFTLEAPDNLTVQNQLATMSTEERGKLALTMLATGLYLAEGNSSSGFNVNSALNAFLQSEISNIAGSALKSIDISVGVEDGTTATGASTTDYSFRFAKRFWNNRVSVIVGGKVSTGKEVESADQTFIDNVSLEYRLDNGGTRYVRLFYDKDVEDLLEGNLSEAGAGLVLRKKMDKLSDLFIFRKTKTQ
jgi:hypothetical protein